MGLCEAIQEQVKKGRRVAFGWDAETRSYTVGVAPDLASPEIAEVKLTEIDDQLAEHFVKQIGSYLDDPVKAYRRHAISIEGSNVTAIEDL